MILNFTSQNEYLIILHENTLFLDKAWTDIIISAYIGVRRPVSLKVKTIDKPKKQTQVWIQLILEEITYTCCNACGVHKV